MSEADLVHQVPTLSGVPTPPTAVIASGQTTSASVDYRPYNTGIVILPAAFTGSALTFKVSGDGTNFTTLYDGAGSPVTIATVAQGEAFALPAQLAAAAYFQVVSGATEGTARTLTFAFKS